MQPIVAISARISQSRAVNLPNAITVSRLFLTAGFILFVSQQGTWGHFIALILFIIAAISDFVDGWLARKMNLVTPLGKLLDPLADKILVCSAFVYLSAAELCPVWVTTLIIGREFLVTGLRQIAIEAGQVLAADRLGKWKTGFQLTYLIAGMIMLTLDTMESVEAPLSYLHSLTKGPWLLPTSLVLAVGLTVVSGWNYVWSSRYLLKGA
ncbi:MAG: CDP-diacylglycerol--glycerol-3-phosphate 3-phosphatidyltransferase [Verrucomicrobiota bacterium]|jgi:CDP-diacylglycerol--glycerol-3-phosphate 3-phosphatidyltransferase